MVEKNPYNPRWISPPGDTIMDILNERNLSITNFTKIIGYSEDYTEKLLFGKLPITSSIATMLENTLGGSQAFWMTRQEQYLEEKNKIIKDLPDSKSWVNNLPVNDMINYGWISPIFNHDEKENKCFDFFEVQNVEEWFYKYEDLLSITSFRKSRAFAAKAESIISWIRQGEIKSKFIKCKPWDQNKLHDALSRLRDLTKIKDPQKFLPILQSICAECGVAVVVLPTPSGSPVSGATLFTEYDKALLLLSFRYLSDDHLWFSLFHEIAHLLLHGKMNIFLEGLETENDQMEDEANKYAANILIPLQYQSQLKQFTVNNWKSIISFSSEIGISPGIVVGQLQKRGILKYKQLNNLKRKYSWEKIKTPSE